MGRVMLKHVYRLLVGAVFCSALYLAFLAVFEALCFLMKLITSHPVIVIGILLSIAFYSIGQFLTVLYKVYKEKA